MTFLTMTSGNDFVDLRAGAPAAAPTMMAAAAAPAGPVMVQTLNGDDHVLGSSAAEAINGSAGTDRVKGGTGNDTFVFAKGDLVDPTQTSGQMDHIIDFNGSGGYKAYLGVEDDFILFCGFDNGWLTFSHYAGGDAAMQVYGIYGTSGFQGNLLVQMAGGASLLAAGDYKFIRGEAAGLCTDRCTAPLLRRPERVQDGRWFRQ
jgi:Ca2+-binding RTX toxin-like protein